MGWGGHGGCNIRKGMGLVGYPLPWNQAALANNQLPSFSRSEMDFEGILEKVSKWRDDKFAQLKKFLDG
jgi:hypothetical protein